MPKHIVDSDFAETLGHLCIAWNMIEDLMSQAIQLHLDGDDEFGELIVSATTNQNRANILKFLVARKAKSKEARELYKWLISAYSICAENRNILMHSSVTMKRVSENDFVPTHLRKRSKTRLGEFVYFLYDIEKLRTCLHETQAAAAVMGHLITIQAINYIRQHPASEHRKSHLPDYKPLPWPNIPPLPGKLTPLRPGEGQAD